MSMKGIDISGWQEGINLSVVPCDFVICKATEGNWYINEDCDRAYQQAKSLNKCLGVYHYANGNDPMEEALYFVNAIRNYIGEAILVLDWESEGNSSFGKNDYDWCRMWLEQVYALTGVKPLIYCSASCMYMFDGIGDYGFWIAQYADTNPTGYQDYPWNEGAYDCLIRQYSGTGSLPGYSGQLDLNKSYMDRDEWDKHAKPLLISQIEEGIPEDATVLTLAYEVMRGTYGVGETRKKKLGNRYNDVQEFITHIATANVDELVDEVYSGKYGDGSVRKTVLGNRYDEVQKKINDYWDYWTTPSEDVYVVKKGDTLQQIAKKYRITLEELVDKNPDIIREGLVLTVR